MSISSVSINNSYEPTFNYDTYESGQIIDIKNAENLTESRLSGYIVNFIQRGRKRRFRDERLWEIFTDRFQDWTKEMFEIPSREAITDLRNYLRENGVFVYKASRIPISGELAKTANEAFQHVWTQEEITEIIEKDEPFNSRHHPDYRSERMSVINSRPHSPSVQMMAVLKIPDNPPFNGKGKEPEMSEFQRFDATRVCKTPVEDYQSGYIQPTIEVVDEIEHKNNTEYCQQDYEPQYMNWHSRRNQRQQTEDYYRPYPKEQAIDNAPHQGFSNTRSTLKPNTVPTVHGNLLSDIHQPPDLHNRPPQQLNARKPSPHQRNTTSYNSVQPEPVNQYLRPQNLNVNNLGNVFKVFQEHHKYSGNSDFLDHKLRMFYDICNTFGVPQHQFSLILPALLKGAAHEYYYDYLAGQRLEFGEICVRLKRHFETVERQYELLNEWHNLSLTSTVRQYPGLSMLTCFEKLVSELQKIRRGLDREYQTDKAMRNRLQLACRDVEACSSATLKPALTFEGLCADIRLGISVKSRFTQLNSNHLLTDCHILNKTHEPDSEEQTPNNNNLPYSTLYTDRRYHTSNRPINTSNKWNKSSFKDQRPYKYQRAKKCFVC